MHPWWCPHGQKFSEVCSALVLILRNTYHHGDVCLCLQNSSLGYKTWHGHCHQCLSPCQCSLHVSADTDGDHKCKSSSRGEYTCDWASYGFTWVLSGWSSVPNKHCRLAILFYVLLYTPGCTDVPQCCWCVEICGGFQWSFMSYAPLPRFGLVHVLAILIVSFCLTNLLVLTCCALQQTAVEVSLGRVVGRIIIPLFVALSCMGASNGSIFMIGRWVSCLFSICGCCETSWAPPNLLKAVAFTQCLLLTG